MGRCVWNQANAFHQLSEPHPLTLVQVPLGLGVGISRSHQLDPWPMPEPRERRTLSIGGGEENVGVEEEAMHASGFGLAVRNPVGVESHSTHFAARPFVVLEVNRVL